MKGIGRVVYLAPFVSLLFLPTRAPAFGAEVIEAGAIRLDYSWGEQNRLLGETFEMTSGVAAAAAKLGVGDRLVILDFPVAPGERGDVEFERVDVYHPGARIVVIDENGEHEIPRSPRVHLSGVGAADRRIRFGVSLDPDGIRMTGLVAHPSGVFELAELDRAETPLGRRSYEIVSDRAERLGIKTQTTCGVPDAPLAFDPGVSETVQPPAGLATHTHEAALAFDTDGEFVGGYASTAAANSAIGDFVTAVNVMYERDLALRLQQAYTILRTSTATDPYSGATTTAQLGELGTEWETNQAGIPRTWVALLSGKGFLSGDMLSCSGAGLAWLDQYCDTVVSGGPFDGGSYSATQVLRCLALDSPKNTRLIGHEVGHNAGSPHTHCYSPEVDQCYASESGCWAGALSCPTHGSPIPAGKGTVMSYCHFSAGSGGAACGDNASYFQSTVSTFLQGRISDNTPACVSLAATCGAGINELTVGNTTDSGGPTAHDACISVTFGPDYTSAVASTVSSDAPLVVFGQDISLAGTFTVSN